MTRDWDLWPWILADGAGALPAYRLERGIGGVQSEIGLALYPVFRRLASDLDALLRDIA